MRVTRLEVFGFKSFMERLVLPLEGGITGVVGPNGCGKSNIVDALRWVLGETRASNLRGDVLEDVIFNGTDKLRPLGLAEVTITLRAQSDNFFEDLLTPQAEMELAALAEQLQLEEVGSTEVLPEPAVPLAAQKVGGASSQEESSPEGEGRKIAHLTVIQGNLGAKREDTEEFSPDSIGAGGAPSAGSGVLDAAVSSKVVMGEQASQALLARFSWLKSANEVQITRRLYRSGESEFFINRVPCRLKDIKDLLRAVGLGPRSYTIVAQGEVSRIITARPEERRLILEEAAGVLGLRDRVAATKRRLEETTQNLTRLDDVVGEVTRQVNSLKRQAARAQARAEIKARIAILDRAIFTDKLVDFSARVAAKASAVATLRAEEEGCVSKLQAIQAEEESARGALLGLDVSGDSLRSKIDAIREELNNRSRSRFEATSRVKSLQAAATAKVEECKQLEERVELLQQRSSDSTREVESLRAQLSSVSLELAQIERGDDEELRLSAAALSQARDVLRAKEQELRQVRERVIAVSTSLDEIDTQIVSLSPLTQLQKTLGQTGSDVIDKIRASSRLFVDALKVPEIYTKAVQSLLAERAGFLLAENPHQIAQDFVSGPLKDPRIKKAGLGLGVFRSGIAQPHVGVASVPFPSLLSLIGFETEASRAATAVFSRVYIAPNLFEASQFFASASAHDTDGVTVVTMDGEILTAESFFTLPHDGGIIQLRNRADQLRLELAEVETQQAALHAGRELSQSELAVAEERHRTALRVSQERQTRARQLANEQGSARGRLEAAERLATQLVQDIQKITDQINAAQGRADQLATEHAQADAELNAMTSEGEEALKGELETLNAEYAQLDPVRKESRQRLSAASQGVEDLRRSVDRARNLIAQGELDRQRIELEMESIKERVTLEYGAEVCADIIQQAQQGTRLNGVERDSYADEVEKLKARVIREGDVDPTTIEQYEIENRRLEELTHQHTDLETAIVTLKRTVEQLTETSQLRFLATFNAVRENFSKLMPRLFGGGKGSLELSDPQHPLESGVEIIARPPGKKLKSIELMSGGEKALCATGLIFSMFLVRPSPLCVLDEVDAPLDDANLVRLLSLIKEMSARTQFIMITHNKQSMSAASNLVGVTMQEPGATRIITVSLQEAFKQVG